MQRCIKCLIDNADHRRFCRRCGSILLVPCGRCGFANSPDDLFCGGCGGRIEVKADVLADLPASEAVPVGRQAVPALPAGQAGGRQAAPAAGAPKEQLFSDEDIADLARTQKTSELEKPEKGKLGQDDIDKIFDDKG